MLLADLLVLAGAFALAVALRFDDLRVENEEYYNYYVQLIVFLILSWVLISTLVRSHDFYVGIEIRKSIGRLSRGIMVQVVVLALLLVSLKGYYYSRLFFSYFYLIFIPLLFLIRYFLITRMRLYLKNEAFARPVALIGNTPEAATFLSTTKNHTEFGLRVAAHFDGDERNKALEYLAQNPVDELYCALPAGNADIAFWARWCNRNMTRFRYLPNLGLKNLTLASVELMGEIPVIVPHKEPLEYRHNRLAKRAFDVAFSLIIILAVMTWLLPILAFVIILDSRGPIFFIQERTGMDNRTFRMIKLRTMYKNAEANTRQAEANDERITQAGHFLRRFHLDELPQLLNVLIGQMSVVGPRPHMLNHTEKYRQIIEDYMVRHYIKPGVTGLAQSRGLSGEITHTELLRERVKADVYYLENWSIWLDLKIIIDTLAIIFKGKSA